MSSRTTACFYIGITLLCTFANTFAVDLTTLQQAVNKGLLKINAYYTNNDVTDMAVYSQLFHVQLPEPVLLSTCWPVAAVSDIYPDYTVYVAEKCYHGLLQLDATPASRLEGETVKVIAYLPQVGSTPGAELVLGQSRIVICEIGTFCFFISNNLVEVGGAVATPQV